MKILRILIMLIVGLVLIIYPNSLSSVALLVSAVYLIVTGLNALVLSLTLVKYKKGWKAELIRGVIFSILGVLILFNSDVIAKFLTSLIFVIIGIILIITGIITINRNKEVSNGAIIVVTGALIALFPMGFSFFIVRSIGVIMTIISILLLTKKLKSS